MRYSIVLLLPFLLTTLWAACGGAASAEEHNRAGIKHFEERRLQEALNEYNEAILLDPEFAAAYFNRGQTYFTLGQSQRALSDYDKAISLSPDHPQLPLAHAGRALAYTLLDDDVAAQEAMAEAVRRGYDGRRLIAEVNIMKKQR